MAGMAADEITVVDLETALEFYRSTGDEDVYVPGDLTPLELSELRDACRTMQGQARQAQSALDARIAALRLQLAERGIKVPGNPVEN